MGIWCVHIFNVDNLSQIKINIEKSMHYVFQNLEPCFGKKKLMF